MHRPRCRSSSAAGSRRSGCQSCPARFSRPAAASLSARPSRPSEGFEFQWSFLCGAGFWQRFPRPSRLVLTPARGQVGVGGSFSSSWIMDPRFFTLPVVSLSSGGGCRPTRCTGDLGRDPPGTGSAGTTGKALLCHLSPQRVPPLGHMAPDRRPCSSSQTRLKRFWPPPTCPPPHPPHPVMAHGVCSAHSCGLRRGPELAPQLGSALRGPPHPPPSGSALCSRRRSS